MDLDAGDQSEDAEVDKELEETLKRLTGVSVQDVVEPAGEEAEESDTATPPGSPLGGGKGLNTALLTREEQLDILQAAQDILTRQDLYDQLHFGGILYLYLLSQQLDLLQCASEQL